MSRYDRKRWWDGRPQTRKDRRKWYGILMTAHHAGWDELPYKGAVFNVKIIYRYHIAEWKRNCVFHLDQKMTLEEAEVMCKLLNAAEENKT